MMQATQISMTLAGAWPSDNSMASGGSPDTRHPHSFWVVHRLWSSTQIPVSAGPRTQTWPSAIQTSSHGPRWQYRPPNSVCSSPPSLLKFRSSTQYRNHFATLSLLFLQHIPAQHSVADLSGPQGARPAGGYLPTCPSISALSLISTGQGEGERCELSLPQFLLRGRKYPNIACVMQPSKQMETHLVKFSSYFWVNPKEELKNMLCLRILQQLTLVAVPQNTENGTHTHTLTEMFCFLELTQTTRANSSNLISTYSSQGFSRWAPKGLQWFALSSNSAKVTDEKKQKERLRFRCARGKLRGKTNNLERLPCAHYMRGTQKERKRDRIQKRQLQWNTCKLS